MKHFDSRVAIGVGIIGIICVLWLLATGILIWSTLDDVGRDAVAATLWPRFELLILMWAISLAAVGIALRWLVAYFMTAPARLVEDAQVLLRTDIKRKLKPTGSIENRRLTNLINQLVQQRETLREEMGALVEEAAHNTEVEKNRLAALMSELSKSVVVCNLDGDILLYNNRAKRQFKRFSQTPKVASGAELIGLGRSIYNVINRELLTHAQENIQNRIDSGIASPSTQFVTTTQSGQLLRVQMAPVRAAHTDNKVPTLMTGFVLLTENITHEFEVLSHQEHVLNTLTERSRAAIANMQAALDVLEYPDLEKEMYENLLGVLREEARGLGERIHELKATSINGFMSHWSLENMLGADLVEAAIKRINALKGLTATNSCIDNSIWLKVESFTLLETLLYLAELIHIQQGINIVELRLDMTKTHGQLDLCWTPKNNDKDIRLNCEDDSIKLGGEESSLTIHDVVERHDGAFWFKHERESNQALFRFLIPLAKPQEQLDASALTEAESRPEFYDFDLFQASTQTRSLEDRKLIDLSFTVFDTETTGLDPAGGDEIIQIGAIRIVNGKLLQQESFEQLVDPQRTIPAVSIPIHGIKPEMVTGQPVINDVLPAFHAFVGNTVLVAHNAAFDMRCLQVKEAATGVVFDQPVLDTLLLSAVAHPNQQSHGLDTIAERFNIDINGRHTALGDAMATAEVFLHLIDQLAEQGIHTMGQAREAAQKTYYARLKY